jgi:hypothetical protein
VTPGLSWAKVLERTMGVMTAPLVGSGGWPAWMAMVSRERARGGLDSDIEGKMIHAGRRV